MQNYFENEIKNMERELVRLKTAAQRSSAVVSTVSQSVDISISLSLNAAQTSASGQVRYRISTESDALVSMTLAKYYDDVNIGWQVPRATRVIILEKSVMGSDIIATIIGTGTQGANSDVSTLINGGSVTLTTTMTVMATDNFTIERIN